MPFFSFAKPILSDRGGNAGVMTALFALLLATIAGGATDLTGVGSTGEKLQDAADSAALAATLMLVKNPSASQAQLKAKAEQMAQPARKGMSDKAVNAAVTVEATAPARVKVALSQDYAAVFGALVGKRTVTVTRDATAMAGENVELCMLLLSQAPAALTVGGTADLNAVKCSIQVNSPSPNALASNGNATVKSHKVYVVGSKKPEPNFKPQPAFNQTPVPDPFAATMPWPAPGACARTLGSIRRTTLNLLPGVICGNINIGNGGTLKLAPGVYVLQSGSISVKSGGVLDGGSSATLVLTDPVGTVTVQAGGSLILEGAKSGPWKNVALAIKPQPTEQTSTLIGGGDFVLDGIVYAPTQKIVLSGGASIEKKESPRVFVANRMELSGNGQVFLRSQPGRMVKGAPVRLVQ
ncbi:MAG TPA: pilus assembly protein TadG-related protein [Caulobacteraceae bacterium]